MKTDQPVLSIIITCYNYADFVGRAIDSVISQENDAVELLVVDDGSLDGSWDVIKSYGLPGCFRVVNGGAARACSYAFRRSRAPFVLFLDADDELAPGSLTEILKHLDPGVAKLQFALTPIDAQGRVLGPPLPRLRHFRDSAGLRREVLHTGVYTSPPTSGNVFRRDVCELLADVDYETWVDGVTLFAAPFFGDVVSLSTPLGRYRLHARNHSQAGLRPQASRFRMEAARFVDRHAHLGRILAQRDPGIALPAAESLFFHRERQLYVTMLSGDRPPLLKALRLAGRALASSQPLPRRCAMALFLTLCAVLPRGSRDALLDVRFRLAKRRRWSGFGRSATAKL